jgi:hypothetical protein
LIAFVQDKKTKEIYQSVLIAAPALKRAPVTGIENPAPIASSEIDISIFPNPASGMFTFGLPDNLPLHCEWKVIDQRGVEILKGDFNDAVNQAKQVDVTGLSSGVYHVVISQQDQPLLYKKLVLLNRN